MKLPRPRFTLRWLMVAVAIVAIGLGVERAWTLRAIYRQRANFHDSRLSMLAVIRDRGELTSRPFAIGNPSIEGSARAARRFAGIVAYHEAMRRKYEAAASHPWLPIAPDPPEPE